MFNLKRLFKKKTLLDSSGTHTLTHFADFGEGESYDEYCRRKIGKNLILWFRCWKAMRQVKREQRIYDEKHRKPKEKT